MRRFGRRGKCFPLFPICPWRMLRPIHRIFEENPAHECRRDTPPQHFPAGPDRAQRHRGGAPRQPHEDAVGTMCGQHALGLEPPGQG
jgi:hypothetical protein